MTDEPARVVRASRTTEATTARIFELIADRPTAQHRGVVRPEPHLNATGKQ